MTPIRNRRTLVLAFLMALCVCALRPVLAGLPTVPNTTYVPGTTPYIKAVDLNQIQQYLAGLYSALFTVKALDVDGTGGGNAGAAPGTVRVSSTVSAYSTTPPFAMPAVPVGQVSREHVILGAAHCTTLGGVLASCGGFNIRSVTSPAVGAYRIILNTALPDVNRHVLLVTAEIHGSPTPIICTSIGTAITAGGYDATIFCSRTSEALVAPDAFHVVVVGG